MVRQAFLAMAVLVCATAPASAAPQWAPADSAPIHPGGLIGTDAPSCTTNFVFYDAEDVYVGTAAHCVSPPSDTVVLAEPCGGWSEPLGTPLMVEGATRPAHLVYSSWLAMQAAGETDFEVCNSNDFALARLDRADIGRVNPSVPVWGGPTGLRSAGERSGETVVSYGRSNLHAGLPPLFPREGRVETSGEWKFEAHFVTPGVFGDSGSAVLDGAGAAAGVLVTINSIPPAANGTTRLIQALRYMRAHTDIRARLATGTEPFTGGDLPTLVDSPAPEPDPQPEPAPPGGQEPAPAQREETPPAAPAQPPASQGTQSASEAPAAQRPAAPAKRGRVTRREARACAKKRTRRARRACLRRAARS